MNLQKLYTPPYPGQIALVACGPGMSWLNKMRGACYQKSWYEVIVSAGFNVISCNADVSDMDKIFNALTGLNLKVIIRSAALLARIKLVPDASGEIAIIEDDAQLISMVEKYKNKPGLWGWEIKDEPSYEDLNPPIANNVADLPFSYGKVKELSPDKEVYFNLAASWEPYWIGNEYATEASNALEAYRLYLEGIQNNLQPTLWSYDFYACRLNVDTKKPYVKEEFFYFLESFANISSQNGVPFWAYVLTTKHNTYEYMTPEKAAEKYKDDPVKALEMEQQLLLGSIYQEPSEAMIRFQAFSALAYGAQGLVYWTYGLNENRCNYGGVELYFDAPINAIKKNPQGVDEGVTSPIWVGVRNVNLEIKSLNYIFAGCAVENLVHLFNSPSLSSENWKFNGITYTDGVTFSFDCAKNFKTGNQGILVSFITNNSAHYMVIVNHDPYSSQKIEFTSIPGYDLAEIQVISHQTEQNDSIKDRIKPEVSSIIKKTLPPGGYVIFRYTKSS